MEKKFNTKRLDTEWLNTGEKDIYNNDIYLGDMIIFTSCHNNKEYVGIVQMHTGSIVIYNPSYPNEIRYFEWENISKTARILHTNLIKRKLLKS